MAKNTKGQNWRVKIAAEKPTSDLAQVVRAWPELPRTYRANRQSIGWGMHKGRYVRAKAGGMASGEMERPV
jgi:hypothetical protein